MLLAASVPARPGERILDLGCGGGGALICLGRRVAGLSLTGVELQPAYAALARQNLTENGLAHPDSAIHCADLRALPADVKAARYDHVLANPPYFDPTARTAAHRTDRDIARAGDTPLADWVQVAAKRTRPRGTVTFIQRAERLPDLLSAARACLGGIELWPLSARAGRAPRLILLRGRPGVQAPFRFHAPLVLHDGAHHSDGAKDYTPAIAAALEHGAALPFPA